MSNSDISREYYFSVPKHIKKGEEIVIFSRPHILSFFPEIILIVLLALAPLVLLAVLNFVLDGVSFLANQSAMNIFILGSSAYYLTVSFFAFAEWINYYYDVLIVTKTHLIDIDQKTIFNREISQLNLAQIEDVTSQIKGFFSTLFAFGNVIVQTAGATENTLIKNIPNPQKVSAKIIRLHSQSLRLGRAAYSQPASRLKIDQMFVKGETTLSTGAKSKKIKD